MDKSIKEKLFSLKSYEEAKPILETVSVSGHELAKTAYSIMQKQPIIANSFLKTVIQEIEDKEEEKKVAESDGGSSHQASSTTGLEKKGTEHDAPESASAQPDKKDQMGVAINEAFPPMMPPMQGGQCGQPQMNPQQQMQYTISETVKLYMKPIHEALKALDKKIKETQKETPRSLEIGSTMGKVIPRIKETTNSQNDLENARQEITRMNNMIYSGKY